MAWQVQLIELYLYVDYHYHKDVWIYCQRLSNNNSPDFSDIEVITVYLWGIMRKQREIKVIYEYTRDHLSEWFPQMPSYVSYVRRLNRIRNAFPVLIAHIQSDISKSNVSEDTCLVDSMPIIMANAKRSNNAKVAQAFANKGYCASKKMYFYGVKLHILAFSRPGTIPLPDYIGLTPGKDNDLTTLRMITPAETAEVFRVVC